MGWIAVDLDRTLAYYDGWSDMTKIGPPLMPMEERVRQWLKEGKEVRIFTVRHLNDDGSLNVAVAEAIHAWCRAVFGRTFVVTNGKDRNMIELWDDRAVRVEGNTGRPMEYAKRRRADRKPASRFW